MNERLIQGGGRLLELRLNHFTVSVYSVMTYAKTVQLYPIMTSSKMGHTTLLYTSICLAVGPKTYERKQRRK